jgi:TPR repeat protein
MRLPLLGLVTLFALSAACTPRLPARSSPQPAQAVHPVAPTHPTQPVDGEWFDPPFEAEHPFRGPGLHLNGMRLVGDRGACQLLIAAFGHGRDIVFFVSKSRDTPANWLDACPRSAKNPKEPRIEVSLQGVGDVSRNAVYETESHWWMSVDVEQYARLRAIRLEVCGSVYALSSAHDARIALHARLASERAAKKQQEEGALPGACQAGDGAACVELGALTPAKVDKRRWYQRACSLRDLTGCSRLADMLLQGEGGERDPEQAVRILLDSCDKGHGGACLGASRAMIKRPSAQPTSSAEPRYRHGAALARRACELAGTTVAVSCLWAAELHATGFGAPADPGLVASFSERSCRDGYDRACKLRGDLVACAKGLGEGCARLAEAERRSRYRALKDDGKEALWRLAACRGGHVDSCAAR